MLTDFLILLGLTSTKSICFTNKKSFIPAIVKKFCLAGFEKKNCFTDFCFLVGLKTGMQLL